MKRLTNNDLSDALGQAIDIYGMKYSKNNDIGEIEFTWEPKIGQETLIIVEGDNKEINITIKEDE